MSEEQETQSKCPYPQEFQEKMQRLGWDTDSWVPTPGVDDEGEIFYISLGARHIRVVDVTEAMALSDDELRARIEQVVGMTAWDMSDVYGVESADEWRAKYGGLEQEVIL